MRYWILIIILYSFMACDSTDERRTKSEVLAEYEGEANLDDVYLVDTVGDDTVLDTLPTVVVEADTIEKEENE